MKIISAGFLFFLASCGSETAIETAQPESTKKVHPPEALALHDSAFHLYFGSRDSANLARAIDLYNQALAIDPHNFNTLHNKIALETQLGMDQQALETARMMLRESNSDIMVIGMVGAVLERTGDSAQARRYFQWSLEVSNKILDTMDLSNPQWLTVQMNKASVLVFMGQQADADAAYELAASNADESTAAAIRKYIGVTKKDIARQMEEERAKIR